MPRPVPASSRALLAVVLAMAACGAHPQRAYAAGAPDSAPVFARSPEREDPRYTWTRLTPLTLLDVLRGHPRRTMWLHEAPSGWFTAADLARLREVAASAEPAAVTCPFFAAHAPPQGASSTVGKEARNMLEAAVRGWPWPSGCSDL